MFGFKLSKSSVVDLDGVELSLFEELCRLEPDARRCIACGRCSATCVAATVSGMSLRKVLHALQIGRERDAMKMLSGCMLCGKCAMLCPRGINTRGVILAIGRVYKG